MTKSEHEEQFSDDQLTADIAGLRKAFELYSSVLFDQALSLQSRSKLSVRESIFYSSCARCLRTARAIWALFDPGYVEEMNMLARPLAEGVINACFLQGCDDAELKAFLSFDSIDHFRSIKRFENLMGRDRDQASAEYLLLEEQAAHAAVFSGRTERDLGWTSKGINKRAQQVDDDLSKKGINAEIFQQLVHTVYSNGHSYVHYTLHNLRSHLAPKQGDRLREARYTLASVHLGISDLSFFGELTLGFKSDPRSGEAHKLTRHSFGDI